VANDPEKSNLPESVPIWSAFRTSKRKKEDLIKFSSVLCPRVVCQVARIMEQYPGKNARHFSYGMVVNHRRRRRRPEAIIAQV
jgi:hypothetical protein